MANTGLQDSKVVWVTNPAAIVDDAAFTTAEVDTKGYNHATLILRLGATDVAMAALAVTESDTTGSGHGNIAVFGTTTLIDGSTSAIPGNTAGNTTHVVEMDLRSRKRFIDVTATAGNGSTGTYLTALCLLTAGGEQKQDSSSRGHDQTIRL